MKVEINREIVFIIDLIGVDVTQQDVPFRDGHCVCVYTFFF